MTRFLKKIKDLQAKIQTVLSADDFDDIAIRRTDSVTWVNLTKTEQRRVIEQFPADVYTKFTAFPVTPIAEILTRFKIVTNEDLALWVVTKMIND